MIMSTVRVFGVVLVAIQAITKSRVDSDSNHEDPVMAICAVPFVLRSNKPCSKQSSCQWVDMRLRSCDDTIMTIPQSTILRMDDSHLGIRNSVSKWLCPNYTELMWFYCNDNAAKRDFDSQTAYSQFVVDIVIRSGIIHYKLPNLKRESLDVSIIWFWRNSQGTGD